MAVLLQNFTREEAVAFAEVLRREIEASVAVGSEVYTDALRSYDRLKQQYAHEFVDHAERYVRGNVHTNGIENFWTLLKRTIKGTYTSVEPFHLSRYLDEQMFRFNTRTATDFERFEQAVQAAPGKRLTYSVLTDASAPN
jgi:transposase-like protein